MSMAVLSLLSLITFLRLVVQNIQLVGLWLLPFLPVHTKVQKRWDMVPSRSSRFLPNKTTYFRWALQIETLPSISLWLDCLLFSSCTSGYENEKSNEEHPMVSASPFLLKKTPEITTTGNMAFSSPLWHT
jgi:hypothetical protein